LKRGYDHLLKVLKGFDEQVEQFGENPEEFEALVQIVSSSFFVNDSLYTYMTTYHRSTNKLKAHAAVIPGISSMMHLNIFFSMLHENH
jgi:hypothetical protein